MSCISNHITSTTAGVVVVLVVSLIIFWTSMGTSNDVRNSEEFSSQNATTGSVSHQSVEHEIQRIDNGVTPQYRPSSTLTYEQNKVSDFSHDVADKTINDINDSIQAEIDDIPSTNGKYQNDTEVVYVMPLKMSKNQDEDPPDEQSTAQRHHSGNFRLPTASVWDPHPQYKFKAFGRDFVLLLQPSPFLSAGVKVTHIKQNGTVRVDPSDQSLLRGCFYYGKIDGESESDVTVSLCGGMEGLIRTPSGSYHIKPVKEQNWTEDGGQSLKHVFYRIVDDSSSTGNDCGVIGSSLRGYNLEDGVPVPLIDESSADEWHLEDRHRERRSSTANMFWDHSPEAKLRTERSDKFIWSKKRRFHSVHDNTSRRHKQWRPLDDQDSDQFMHTMDPLFSWRNRRAVSQKYFIEIMVVADQKMIDYHGSGLVHYILILMSTVYRIYKDPSIGNPISIAVLKIVPADREFGHRHNETNGIAAGEMLQSFCEWQNDNNPNEPSPHHHDAALLLTRENLCQDPTQKRCETLGLAHLGGMCSTGSSCAIVQDNGLPTAFTIAHELGHVLNMPHDDDSKCKKFQGRSNVHNFMTPRLDSNSFRWEWSKCSRHYLTEFLENMRCLLDEPNNVLLRSDSIRLPGEFYSGNKQCELAFGRGAKICTHIDNDVCKRLWCTKSDDRSCRSQNMPWADGTPCNEDNTELKWCQRGECVSVKDLEPVHGQWGEWGEYGDCSRTCGGGIQKRYRECNGPLPQNGGDYCIGERVEDRSCGTNECSLDAVDFREEQCSKFNNNNLKIRGLDNNTEWHAKYTRLIPEDRCKLFCQVESKQYYMLRDKVIDGTPCGPDTFDICVHGHCKPAGCDHILNSTAVLDTCGVCRGDNSTCQRITGSHNSSHYGYTRVIKIPAGSSNIDIKQYGWSGSHNDSNYLALRLGEGGKYILNGNCTIMHRKVIIHPGMTIEYSGPETLVERLNSSRRINVDVILEVLSVGKVHPPQIIYEYTVPKNILKNYKWVLSDWSDCNYICQGMKYRRAQCKNTEYNEYVSDDYCRPEEKPREDNRMCNSYCILEWQVVEASECSNHCGPGNRTISTECVQILKNRDGEPPEPVATYACSHLERPPNQQPCIGPCDSVHWSYGSWEACSVTCGTGIQSRTATCVDTSDEVVSDAMCLTKEKIITRSCSQEACPKWSFGEWSTCSVTCGIGERIRSIWCHIDNRIVGPELCANHTMNKEENCDAGPCYHVDTSEWYTANTPAITDLSGSSRADQSFQHNEVDRMGTVFRSNYKWYPGPYGDCNSQCGEGRRYRSVLCKEIGGKVVPDMNCFSAKKPRIWKRCIRKTCGTSITATGTFPSRVGSKRRWRVSNWTPCSKDCGEGIQERAVTCRRINEFGWVDPLPTDGCVQNKRPKRRRKCKLRECDDEYYWTTEKWRKCSHPCGRQGKQSRRLFCLDASGVRHPRFKCPPQFKPKKERKCNQRRCGPRTCLEAQKRFRTMSDGEYMLLIGGKLMKIYCMNAATNASREYLTLPAGERNNYAEIYDKRLLDPNQCPFDGRRNDSCECVSDVDGISGLTYFKRVRINPATLTIVVDDYTFSWTKGVKRVDFGKAGDCYSNANCPQGRFSIDLTGTLLRLSSDVSWSPTKSRAFLAVSRVNAQKVTGKCGGYCGFCTPKSGLKLDVLPP